MTKQKQQRPLLCVSFIFVAGGGMTKLEPDFIREGVDIIIKDM